MNGLVLMLVSLAAFAAGYAFHSKLLARWLGVDANRQTPAYAFCTFKLSGTRTA